MMVPGTGVHGPEAQAPVTSRDRKEPEFAKAEPLIFAAKHFGDSIH
jgi:hypothetical protein